MQKCQLRITRLDYESLWKHLFPGDHEEHGAVLLAGLSVIGASTTLTVREVHLANETTDYVKGKIGHRALTPQFIHRYITRARDERLVYLAAHNHGSDKEVGFSSIDLASHELGYPALIQIAKGMPVGALVLGYRSIEIDLWMPDGTRRALDCAIVIGSAITRLTPSPVVFHEFEGVAYDRQIRMFGAAGQAALRQARVAIIGLGGIGSLLVEYLAKLGVGNFILVDDDHVEDSNLSRIIGATANDAKDRIAKTSVARRLIYLCNDTAKVKLIEDDVAKLSVALELRSCDYLFLAADSMRARLVINAIVQQYLIPGVQLGSKIRADAAGTLVEVMSANRPLRPGMNCLWCNQLIDSTVLAQEAKSDEEREEQAYGVAEINPSVISLNAVAASHAVNDFLLDYLGLRKERPMYFEHFHFLTGKNALVTSRRDEDCSECSRAGRFGRADSSELPCLEG